MYKFVMHLSLMKPKFFLSCFFLFIFSFQVSFPVIAAISSLHHSESINAVKESIVKDDDGRQQISDPEILTEVFDLLAESKEKSGEEENLDFLLTFYVLRELYSVYSPRSTSCSFGVNISHKLDGLPVFLANRVLRI